MQRPFLKVFTSDILGDSKRRACSLAARGLWDDMLYLMHDSEPYGQLILGGEHLGVKDFSKIALHVGRPASEVKKALDELTSRGILEILEDGTIASRRMLRDEEKRQKKAAAGKIGGEASAQANAVARAQAAAQVNAQADAQAHIIARDHDHIPYSRDQREDLRLPGPDGAQASEPVSLALGGDQPSAPRSPRQQKLPTGPKPEHLLLGAIWPILRARIPVAMTQTDWRKRNTSTAKSMLAAGIEPEQIVRVIEFIGADEEARKWWGETLMLDKIQKAWASIVRRMGERAPKGHDAEAIPEGYIFDAELGAAYPLATLKVLAPERYREAAS